MEQRFLLSLATLRDSTTAGDDRRMHAPDADTGGEQVWNLIVTGSFISVVPLVAAFLSLQKYWQGGLSLGSVR